MEKPQPIGLLEKYLANNCTAEEADMVKKWYLSFEYDDDHLSDLDEEQKQQLRDRIFSQILTDIGKTEDEVVIEKAKVRPLYKWFSVAAAAVVLAVSGLVLYRNTQNNTIQPANNSAVVYQSITNTTGQIYKVTLPDSSSVWMSPNATLKFPKVFAQASRNVAMAGKCFFEVTKNPKRPFIINSHSIITKVWGTSFLVRDDGRSHIADVAVLTGKVSVSINNPKSKSNNLLRIDKGDVMVYPHQKAVYKIDEHVLEAQNTPAEPALQIWNRINLTFENRLLKDIIPVLNQKFNVHIVVTNQNLNHYMFNADLNGFNLPEVLTVLKKSLNIDYQFTDDEIMLNPTNL